MSPFEPLQFMFLRWVLSKPSLCIKLKQRLPTCAVSVSEATHSQPIVKGLSDPIENSDQFSIVLDLTNQRLVESLDHLDYQILLHLRKSDIEAGTFPEWARMGHFLYQCILDALEDTRVLFPPSKQVWQIALNPYSYLALSV